MNSRTHEGVHAQDGHRRMRLWLLLAGGAGACRQHGHADRDAHAHGIARWAVRAHVGLCLRHARPAAPVNATCTAANGTPQTGVTPTGGWQPPLITRARNGPLTINLVNNLTLQRQLPSRLRS